MKTAKTVAVVVLSGWMVACGVGGTGDASPQNGLKLVPPPGGGMYIGQMEVYVGETETLENAIGRKAALKIPMAGTAPAALMDGMEDPGEGRLTFYVEKAKQYVEDGYFFWVGTYETGIGQEFRVTERLLRGEFDDEMHKLAAQLKEYGKPVLFGTTREPNGAGGEYMGGFGENGDQTTEWAAVRYDAGDRAAAFEMFIPPSPPEGAPNLYDGLGDPTFCDGYERLVAAQRYYYDFFVRREGIDFLTFDSMGWWVPDEAASSEDGFARECNNYSKFMKKLEGYYDWVSINWYLTPNYEAGEVAGQPVDIYLNRLAKFMEIVRRAAPGKPVMLSEFGFGDDEDGAKVERALSTLMTDFPEIHAFIMWYDMPPMNDGEPPFSMQVEPGTSEGEAFRSFVERNPDYFHSCVHFSGGSVIANCDEGKD